MASFRTVSIRPAQPRGISRFPTITSREGVNRWGQTFKSKVSVGYDYKEKFPKYDGGSIATKEWKDISAEKNRWVKGTHASEDWRRGLIAIVGDSDFGKAVIRFTTTGAQAAQDGVTKAMQARFLAVLQTEIVNQKKRTEVKPRRWRTAQTRQ